MHIDNPQDPRLQSSSIDLLSQGLGIELKGRWTKYARQGWAVAKEQFELYPRIYGRREYFWAFMLYDYVEQIHSMDDFQRALISFLGRDEYYSEGEKLVARREVRFLPWDFVADRTKFKVRPGQKYDWLLVYRDQLPADETFEKIEREDSVLYFPPESSLLRDYQAVKEIPF
jgi:hypothetical protein